ncbi:protein bric-a-brac 2 [Diachasma alloeum]|uniref:protein bric-a-brac 2 n=1 Tax=Diachasma alloeum TaxID=454923 RepID=UPI00073846C4|nr:protein bric-a-brac 2 [Diachasma alloeum]
MGQFNLRWNNHITNILQVFGEHLSSESLVDVTLSCEGRFIKAHKIILSACSPYFQELFEYHTSKHPVIILNGVKYEDLQSMIKFMYNGEIRVEESELTDLLSIAEILQVKGLCNVRDKKDRGNEKAAELKEEEKRECDFAVSKNDSAEPSAVNAECKLEDNDRYEEREKNRPKKRRKMSHRVNELANETTFTSHQTICLGPEETPNSPEPIQPEPIPTATIKVPRPPNEETKKSKIKTKVKSRERQSVIYGENGPEKIRRPPNAFMIFANEWRRRLATENPRESNTEISVRLGAMWKGLTNETKDSYYALAKKVDEEHKRKYPGYFYSPKEARMRKNLKNDLMLTRCLPPTGKGIFDSDALQFSQVYMNGTDVYPRSDGKNNFNERKSYLKDIQEAHCDERIFFT